ncbi:hypothetical protein [Algoriphagus confluentis]|uniref:Glycosyltransferase RgtA/B/C/D-like domain-containing protein n=1 Tax=Algoriphagus confluentis TaxID=1697556 RepID=A0ABQ6PIP0_9BACT|nr:hypothetical protein Aconfl_00930 [Algoriphagus confluentis]
MTQFIQNHPKRSAFLSGSVFLFLYWLLGFDGITFSDDVYYLLAGKSFWEGTMQVNAYHFSSRWGAYVPSGLIGSLLGFEPHRISLISLFSYVGSLYLLMKILPKGINPWILVFWASTQVYLLHFLTKVYPDSLLVFWTCLVPFSASFRKEKPFAASLGLVFGLLMGFITKETIVFLAPFPILLFLWDRKNQKINSSFYLGVLVWGLFFGLTYLAYFWIKFGDPFFRVSSINAGHYISEFTYADKGTWAMIRRLTYLPILTWVERSYWLWIVLALPGIWKAWKAKHSPGIEFAFTAFCLILGFWFMSSTLEIYNPIYLNPRHLIILVPILAFLIALGWGSWEKSPKIKLTLASLIALGVCISFAQQDLKMVLFQTAFLGIFLIKKQKIQTIFLGALLIVPALASIHYQERTKGYSDFIEALSNELNIPDNQSIIVVNNFVKFSEEVLFPKEANTKNQLFPLEKLDSLQAIEPKEIRVFIYEYFHHAYPKEQEDVELLETWLQQNFSLEEEIKNGKVWIRTFKSPSH